MRGRPRESWCVALSLTAIRAGLLVGEQGGAARLKRRVVEWVLNACADERGADSVSLLALLRQFAVEAAREEALLFCDDLVADACIMHADNFEQTQLVAA